MRQALTPDEIGTWAARYGANAVQLGPDGHIVGVSFFERGRDAYGRQAEPDATEPTATLDPVSAAIQRLARGRAA